MECSEFLFTGQVVGRPASSLGFFEPWPQKFRVLGFGGLVLVSMQSVERRNLLVTKVVDFAHQAGCHLWLLLQVASWASRARTRRGGGRTRRGRSGVLEAVAAICVKLG